MSYLINAPITFAHTTVGAPDILDFQAGGASTLTLNQVSNFVTTTAGDMLYRDAGGSNLLERLPIGTNGQVLTSNGTIPVWAAAVTTTPSVFTAYVTASVAGIPTSRTGGTNSNAWFNLNNTYVTWSKASPGTDPDNVFNTTTGLFTAPATGTYRLCCQVTFDSGVGVNTGSGITTSVPNGQSIRQCELFNVTTSTVLATTTVQVSASNNNQTVTAIPSVEVPLTLNDTVVVRVRHDRTAANTVTVGDVTIALPSQTYFSGVRVK